MSENIKRSSAPANEADQIIRIPSETFRKLRSFYFENKDAIDFFYADGQNRQRYDFLRKIDESILEGCFNHPVSEKLKEIIRRKPRTDQGREEKFIEFAEELTIEELIALYQYMVPANAKLMPTSPALNQLNRLTSAVAAGKLPEAPRDGAFEIKPPSRTSNRLSISYKSKSGRELIRLTFKDHSLFTSLVGEGGKGNAHKARTYKGLRRMFAFLLMICNENGFKSEISFDIRKTMVNEYKMYSTLQKAMDALNRFSPMITDGLKYSIEVRRIGKKPSVSAFDTGADGFIKRIKAENGIATIYLNESFDYSLIAETFTLLPKWSYSLDPNPFALIQYIFEQARRNTKTVYESKQITIGFDSIRQNLGLPVPGGKDDHNKIRKPIENAIEKIEDSIQANNDREIKIDLLMKDGTDITTAKIKEWLRSGYLRVTFPDNYIRYFRDREDERETERKKAEQRRRRIEEKKMNYIAEAKAKEELEAQNSRK